MTLEDGLEGLAVNGGGLDGGDGATFANGPGDDEIHSIGSLHPVVENAIGAIVIDADGGRRIVSVQKDPLA